MKALSLALGLLIFSSTQAQALDASVTLHAETSSRITKTEKSIKFLETNEATDYLQVGLDEYECSALTQAGMTFSYKVLENSLVITFDGMQEVYSRQGNGDGLNGKWLSVDSDEDGYEETILDFTDYDVKIAVKCVYE